MRVVRLCMLFGAAMAAVVEQTGFANAIRRAMRQLAVDVGQEERNA
jgi:hypothetical protein